MAVVKKGQSRGVDDETLRKRLVKSWEIIKDNQCFETDLNLISDLDGLLLLHSESIHTGFIAS